MFLNFGKHVGWPHCKYFLFVDLLAGTKSAFFKCFHGFGRPDVHKLYSLCSCCSTSQQLEGLSDLVINKIHFAKFTLLL